MLPKLARLAERRTSDNAADFRIEPPLMVDTAHKYRPPTAETFQFATNYPTFQRKNVANPHINAPQSGDFALAIYNFRYTLRTIFRKY